MDGAMYVFIPGRWGSFQSIWIFGLSGITGNNVTSTRFCRTAALLHYYASGSPTMGPTTERWVELCMQPINMLGILWWMFEVYLILSSGVVS